MLPSVSQQSMSTDRRQPSAESQKTPSLPASTSYASTAHARVPSSQDGAPTPKPPGTPQTFSHPSPVVIAATPEQPQHPDPTTPTARTAPHQASRSQSGGVVTWDRSQARPPRPVSSADAYMKPIETLQSETSSRPGTAMSHLSGSNWMHDGPGNRSSVGTTSTMPMNQMKRASVLSFQTANSAGFTSGDEGRASDREDLADDTLLAGPSGAMNTAQSHPAHVRPWLEQAHSGYASSPDERQLPGGLPGSFWDEPSMQPPPQTMMPPAAIQQDVRPSPASADVGTPATPIASTSASTAQTGVSDIITKHEDAKTGDGRINRDMEPVDVGSSLAPINTQGLAPASPNAPLSSTTIAGRSDETTQAMTRSPDITKLRKPSLPLPEMDAPPPVAKDVAFSGPSMVRNGGNQGYGGEASPIPADNVIPPPLPTEAVKSQPVLTPDMLMNGPAEHRPVSDYRKKPLADISPAQKAAGLAHLQAQAKAAKQANMEMQMQAHPPPTQPPAEAPPIPDFERGRRKSNASLTANVAMAQAAAAAAAAPGMVRGDLVDRPSTPSVESESSRESSAPPDGEVEARAEWERRRRMKRKNGKNNKKQQQSDATKQPKGRSDTFKNQLRPLQLVPADNINGYSDRNGVPNSAASMVARGPGDRSSIALSNRSGNAFAPSAADTSGSGQTYSTQQLQRLQAREQRRSVGAFSAAMAAANVVSSGSNGPYPVFASPNTGPQKAGSRQYPGLMAQRSLVPPFELQHRPDGLPSGLIGPDGVRRSLNDPEVCLECMMRDEDMIDITVLGDGIWERESDKEFEEAVRLEAEEAANGNGMVGPNGSVGHSDSISSHRDSRGSRKPRKRIGKGEPLTVERLKLHTQMNPPASSFRWRTLQTFLAVQAKYIAMEQQRMRLESADKKTRYNNDSISSRGSIAGIDSPALGAQSERRLSSPFAPPRDASAPSRQSIVQPSVDDSGLTPIQKQEKERDIAAAQAARKKLTAGAAAASVTPPLGMPAYPTTPLQTRTLPQAIPGRAGSEPEDLVAAPAIGAGIMTPGSGRRVPFGSSQAARAASVQDLRSAADASRSSSTGYPPSPADSLMPPSRSFMGASPTGSPSRAAGRSGASQLSLMHSGSMIDMHVAQENQTEHRLNQNGFLPGTPLAVESPAALNRSFYGFPGDGESSLPDAAAFERSRMVSGDGYVDPMEAGPRGLDAAQDDNIKPKKKGFRGLLSKFTGSSGGPSRQNSSGAAGDSINGSIASRNASKRSQGSESSRPRQNSMSADRSLDAVSPAINGMLGKARKSTSSFFRNGVEPDVEPKARPQPSVGNSVFQNPPGMASQNSLDLGPFQPASPQANAFGSTNGRGVQQQQPSIVGSDPARMRKASNPLMQRYLNSPSPATQASPVSSPNLMAQPSVGIPTYPGQAPADARNSRMSSFASMRDTRPPALQSIPDSGLDDNDPRRSMRSSAGSASLRKELPSMPSSAGDARNVDSSFGGSEHQRFESNGTGRVRSPTIGSTSSATRSPVPAPAVNMGRVAVPRSGNGMLGRQAPPAINTNAGNDLGYGAIADDNASINSANPMRPPKNPRRPDGALNSPSIVDLNNGLNAPARDFPQQPQVNRYDTSLSSINSPIASEKTKRSRFLGLPFGRKKRESTLADSKPSIVIGTPDDEGDASFPRPPSQMRSSSSGFLPKLRSRKSYAGLGAPKSSFQIERQRVLSSPAREYDTSTAGPPRSQSAFGMAPTQRFVSMDIPRRSMNVNRSASAQNRLSTVGPTTKTTSPQKKTKTKRMTRWNANQVTKPNSTGTPKKLWNNARSAA